MCTSSIKGYSPGGPSLDPGNLDLSAAATFATSAVDTPALSLAATRPVTGATCSLLTANIPPGTPFGAVLFGSTRFDQGISLASLGMAGCTRYTDGLFSVLFFPTASQHAVNVRVPATAPLGLQVFVQSATYSPPSTLLGFIASNGVALTVGSL